MYSVRAKLTAEQLSHQDASRLHESYRYSERPRARGMVEKLLEWEAEPD